MALRTSSDPLRTVHDPHARVPIGRTMEASAPSAWERMNWRAANLCMTLRLNRWSTWLMCLVAVGGLVGWVITGTASTAEPPPAIQSPAPMPARVSDGQPAGLEQLCATPQAQHDLLICAPGIGLDPDVPSLIPR